MQTDQDIIDLGQYGKYEIQAIKGFYGDAINWKKDLENTRQENKDLKSFIKNLEGEIKTLDETIIKQIKEIEIQRDAYNSLLRAYNTLKSGADADDNHLPPNQTIAFPPIISKFIRWLLDKLR